MRAHTSLDVQLGQVALVMGLHCTHRLNKFLDRRSTSGVLAMTGDKWDPLGRT
jgi:hypothetical protein